MVARMSEPLLLVGTGYMAIEYAKVLQALGREFVTVGRGEASAEKFKETTGHEAIPGGIDAWLPTHKNPFTKAIVAVSVNELGKVASSLLRHGFRSILLEKPGGVNEEEIRQVVGEATQTGAHVYLAYNRRFYASTLKAKEMIQEDGGVTSFQFEFTEWSHVVGVQKIAKEILEHWFLCNSTHVVDLAFFLGGRPQSMSCHTAGGLSWHPAASIFAGAGVAENGALFSYQANWEAPGRWWVEVLTRKHRFIFRPLEELHIQVIDSVAVQKVEIDNALDLQFKPGLYRQVENFLSETPSLCTIEEQTDHVAWYTKICPQ